MKNNAQKQVVSRKKQEQLFKKPAINLNEFSLNIQVT